MPPARPSALKFRCTKCGKPELEALLDGQPHRAFWGLRPGTRAINPRALPLNSAGIGVGTGGTGSSAGTTGSGRPHRCPSRLASRADGRVRREMTRQRVPLDWAMTQNNLVTVLRTLGERERGTARLEEAVTAYRNALQEWTRERVPLDWATTQNNLGGALSTLGARERGTARLEEAVAAYRDALQEWTRQRVPLQWVYSEQGLANALAAIAVRSNDPARLEEAIRCMNGAAEIYREGHVSQWLPVAESRSATTKAELAKMKNRVPPGQTTEQ